MRVRNDAFVQEHERGPHRPLPAAVPEPHRLDPLPALDREIAGLQDLHAPRRERASSRILRGRRLGLIPLTREHARVP